MAPRGGTRDRRQNRAISVDLWCVIGGDSPAAVGVVLLVVPLGYNG
jgi:hypothetical protein